jgi:hypothetical protein
LAVRLGILLLTFMFACAVAPCMAGPRLVVLLITDNIDHISGGTGHSIGPGATNNADHMKEFFEEVGQATELPLIEREVVGAEGSTDPWTCANINNTIKSLPVQAGDTVVVYYAGHGFNVGPNKTAESVATLAPEEFRTTKPTEFPFLYCNRDLSGPSPNLDMIASWIAPKKPRLTIVIADACNTDYPGTARRSPMRLFASRTPPKDRRLISLFRDARGTVLIAGSKGDHESWYDLPTAEHPMGFFTREFLAVIQRMDRTAPTTWAKVGQLLTPIRVQKGEKLFAQVPILNERGPFATVRNVAADPSNGSRAR